MSSNLGLSDGARKALKVHMGEEAGAEIAALLQRMAAQIDELKRSKVNITPILPGVKKDVDDHVAAAIESETF